MGSSTELTGQLSCVMMVISDGSNMVVRIEMMGLLNHSVVMVFWFGIAMV